jgi:hypothetical protein
MNISSICWITNFVVYAGRNNIKAIETKDVLSASMLVQYQIIDESALSVLRKDMGRGKYELVSILF